MSASIKYSVIIPVYNAANTLDRCVQSLLGQQYPNVEIILVNDGSIDHSGQLCQAYADSYDQVKYINKENGGVSSARNVGLDIATGEYILFVDSDDYVSNHYFSTLDSFDPAWDYLIFSYHNFTDDQLNPSIFKASTAEDVHRYFEKLAALLSSKTIYSPWNKRYRRSTICDNHIRFHTVLSIGEDALFNLRYALCCRSCCVSEEPLYFVSLENEQSLSRKVRDDVTEQLALCEQEMRRSVQQADISNQDKQKLIKALNFLHLREVYSESKRMHIRKINFSTRLKTTRRMCKEITQEKAALPNRLPCKLLLLPVKLRLAILVDLVGWKLAH